MSERAAALVIGASVGGLAAASYLARAGLHTLLLEAEQAPREPDGPLIALDPRIVSELRLSSLGLAFTARDLPMAVAGDTPLLLGRDIYASSAMLARLSDADALAWPAWRRRLTTEARRLRRWWWTAPADGTPDAAWSAGARQSFRHLCFSGADAYLAARFETPSLLAALLWDAGAGGLAVGEPGSALALVWRAAQEMGGVQDATAIAQPGSLTTSLMRALGMAQLRNNTRVTHILTKSGGVTGVVLADGSEIEADHIVSTLSRAETLRLAGLPHVAPSIGEARILLRLARGFAVPDTPPARHILVVRPEVHADAHEEARAGRIAAELPMEWVMLAPDLIAVTARPVPAVLSAEQRLRLAAKIVLALSPAMPGLAQAMTGVEIRLRPQRARLADLLAPPPSRLVTPVKGLLLAGEDVEPLPSISGRAGRLAARSLLSS
ncbi:MAG: FAD-dependent oxidoreductase [Pseudomonadota bacterium]